jgi:hypothetical protein
MPQKSSRMGSCEACRRPRTNGRRFLNRGIYGSFVETEIYVTDLWQGGMMDRCIRVQTELFSTLRGKFIALLETYLDESGMHSDPVVVIVGGAITTANNWNHFSANCAPFLKRHGVNFFSTSDFFGSHGDFEGWDLDRKKEFLRKFMPIVNNSPKTIIAHGIRLAEFEGVSAEFPYIRTTPYKYCLENCLAAISTWALKKPRIPPIAVIIEAGNKTYSPTYRLFEEATNYEWLQNKYKLASISIMRKRLPTGEYIYPFQVADMVSNGLWKRYSTKQSDEDPVIYNTVLGLLKIKETFGYVDKPENIRRWFEVQKNNKEYFEKTDVKSND